LQDAWLNPPVNDGLGSEKTANRDPRDKYITKVCLKGCPK